MFNSVDITVKKNGENFTWENSFLYVVFNFTYGISQSFLEFTLKNTNLKNSSTSLRAKPQIKTKLSVSRCFAYSFHINKHLTLPIYSDKIDSVNLSLVYNLFEG
jgi:hypothetical protein